MENSDLKNKLIMIQPTNPRWYDLEDLPNEQWKDIKDYEGLYQVSNYGRVKSLRRNIILKEMKSKESNYRYFLSLSKNGVRKQVKCHRLVAKAFVPNLNKLPEVNHKNPVTTDICDNRSSNLEWVTHQENMIWRVKCGNQPKNTFIKNGQNVCNKNVVQLNKDNKLIQVFPSLRMAMKKTGFHESTIFKVCHKKIKKVGDYVFMFEEEYNARLGNNTQ